MSSASPSPASTADSAPALPATALAVTGGLVAAAVLALAGYAGHDLIAYAELAAALVLAWGWPLMLGLPRPTGSGAVLAIGGLGFAAVGLFAQGDGTQGFSIVLAISLVLAFLHELIRTDGRPHLVLSIAGTALGLAVLTSGAFLVAATRHPSGADAVTVAVGAAALGLAVETVLRRERHREWVLPAALLLGGLLGVLAGLISDGHWNVLLIEGLVCGALGVAVRKVMQGLDPIEPAVRLAYGLSGVLACGVVAYAAQWVIGR